MASNAKVVHNGTSYPDPFIYWMQQLGADNVRCLEANESFTIAGIECGMHGDRGPNGSRGTLDNLSRLGVKINSAHSHTPGIRAGNYQCGTSSYRRLSYQKGPSSHLNTHTVIYASGARSLISIIKGRWKRK